ncbi:cobalt-precorrin 5A hydrolase [Fusobacterium gonidiaformans]|uniref:cobalt-precorrin 5A hydrolase n=1 Tax=Fusobacterium gonidiaformans TaxID=849 RepID=UPI00307EE091
MKIAFWTVTRGAGNIAKEYAVILTSNFGEDRIDVYTLEKFSIKDTVQTQNFTDKLEEKFHSYDTHIFIMASGIVIRKISKLIKSKDIDPAVLLIDEGKHFVISLLSGHLGGANEITYKIASLLNLIPIITTSSDITGKIAVDIISQKLNAELEELKSAKEVTSLIVDGKTVDILLPKNVKVQKADKISKNPDGIIVVSNKRKLEMTRIFPKNLILGIGCKKDTREKEILEAIEASMKKHNLDMRSIKHIATVDIKKDELGLVQAAKTLEKELIIISREEIKKVQDKFEGSDFVEKNIGVRAVSEPVAYLSSSRKGQFLERKAKYQGITISIYEEEIESE